MDAAVAEPPTLAFALAVEERAAARAGARSRRVGLGAREPREQPARGALEERGHSATSANASGGGQAHTRLRSP